MHGEGRETRRGPLPPNALANPSHLLATLARNAIANTVTTVNNGQSQLSNVAEISSRKDILPTQLTNVSMSTGAQSPPKNLVKHDHLETPKGLTENTVEEKKEDEDELKIVRKNLEALSKKDLNLLKSSHSRLYDFPTQVPTVLSSAYSTPQQNIQI